MLLFDGLAVSLALLFIVFCCVFHGQPKEKFIGQHFIFRCPAKAAAAAPTRRRLWSETSVWGLVLGLGFGHAFRTPPPTWKFNTSTRWQATGSEMPSPLPLPDSGSRSRCRGCPIPNMNFPKRGQQAHKYQSRAEQGRAPQHATKGTTHCIFLLMNYENFPLIVWENILISINLRRDPPSHRIKICIQHISHIWKNVLFILCRFVYLEPGGATI